MTSLPPQDDLRFDYDRVGWRFVHRVMQENNRRLSRTHHGESDAGSSREKMPLLLSGERLREKVAENEKKVAQLIFEARNRPNPRDGTEFQTRLFEIADQTNDRLLPAGRFRTWEIRAGQKSLTDGSQISGPEDKTPPDRIEAEVAEFCDVISSRWNEFEHDPLPLAAWAEWQLNGGRLHPFYDGCGRVSRAFGACLLIQGGLLLPLHEDQQTYFRQGNLGHETFRCYLRSAVVGCRPWAVLDKSDGSV